MFEKIILFGDDFGIPILLPSINVKSISAVVLSYKRPSLPLHIKKMMSKNNIPILIQPAFSDKSYQFFYHSLDVLKPDMLICNSYALLIREDILELVNYNAYNIHASYLPFNRGPNPIQWTIIKGEEYTGVTLHRMDRGFDTGALIYQVKQKIGFEDTWVSLRDKLTVLIKEICLQIIPSLLEKEINAVSQNQKNASSNFRLTPDYPLINFNKMTDLEVYNLIRAQIAPLKGAYLTINSVKKYFDKFIPYDEVVQLRKLYSVKSLS